MHIFAIIFCAIHKFDSSSAFWLSPNYWTTIYRNGHVENGRSNENFVSFPESTHMYIGYWISSEKNYHEAYGNVYSKGADKRGATYCGLFVDVYQNKSERICGGFRVLSNKPNALRGKNLFEFVPVSVTINDPDKAVEYLDWQIARYRANFSEKWITGCANILKRVAYFPLQGGQLKKLDIKENDRNILDTVQVLQRSEAFDPQDLMNKDEPTLAPLLATTGRLTTTTRTTTTRMPKTTTLRTTTASTTTQIPEYEHDYDNLPGAGIEWDAILEKYPPVDSAQTVNGGAILSTEDNELIIPKQK